VRPPQKAELMRKGFVYNNVSLGRDLTEKNVVDMFENLYVEKLQKVSWTEGEGKFRIMSGIGQCLVEPCLTQNQSLNAETIHRLFGTKIIWLIPMKNLYDEIVVKLYYLVLHLHPTSTLIRQIKETLLK